MKKPKMASNDLRLKRKVRGYTRRFLQVLEEEDLDIQVRRLGPKFAGFCIGHTIMIDHTATSILSIFVHELLHYLNPLRKEKEVVQAEKLWMKHSSWKQKRAVLFQLCELAHGA